MPRFHTPILLTFLLLPLAPQHAAGPSLLTPPSGFIQPQQSTESQPRPADRSVRNDTTGHTEATVSLPADSLYNIIAIRLDSILSRHHDPRATVSLDVADASTGRHLYRRNATRSLRPASCQKVLTAWAAITALGGNHLFHTRLSTDGTVTDSLLSGHLYVYGEMDPLFGENDLKAFVDTLAAHGIRTIGGDLILDDTYKDNLRLGEGWCWDDDNPVLSPLLYKRRDGLAQALCQALSQAGITLSGQLRTGYTPDGAELLCDRIHTLDAVLLPMMKDSRNLFAESVFYALGRHGGRRATAIEAAAVIARLIGKLGLRPADYRIADGSGLSLYNYASAELLCSVLVAAWNDQIQRRHLVPALPVAGEDGTLGKRMRRTTAHGNVRAKTGTLTGVSTLSGYATTADGRTLAFSIFCSGHVPNAAFHRLQDALCIAMTAP